MMSTLIIMYVKTFSNNQINLMNVYYSYYTKNKTVFFLQKKRNSRVISFLLHANPNSEHLNTPETRKPRYA